MTPRFFLHLAALAVGYFVLAKLGLDLATLNKSASPVWPAAGLAVGGLMVLGLRLWPAIFLGAFAANLLTQSPILSTVAIALGNTGEALLGAFFANRILARIRSGSFLYFALSFSVAAAISPLLAATVGSTSLWMVGALSSDVYISVWSTWWVGDAIGILSIAPLVWCIGNRFEKWPSPQDVGMLIGSAILSWVAFSSPPGSPLLFLVFAPFLFGFSPHSDIRGCLLSVVSMGIGVWITVNGHGPFVQGTPNQNLISLQLFLGSLAVSSVVLHSLHKIGLSWVSRTILGVTWVLAAFMFHSFSVSEHVKDESVFHSMVLDRTSAIETRLATYEEGLRSGAALFAASERVTADEWREFVKSLDVNRRLPGLYGLGVIWRASSNERNSFIKEVRSEGLRGFALRSVPSESLDETIQRDSEVWAIKYIEPIAENRVSLGLVINSERIRRKAAELSRDTGKTSIASQITLVQDRDKRLGFHLYFPIYKNRSAVDTVESRKKNHIGWIYSPMTWKGLLEGVLGSSHAQVQFEVIEKDSSGAFTTLYDTNSDSNLEKSNYDNVTNIRFGQSDFVLAWNRGPEFQSSHDTVVAWVGFVSTIIGLLLASVIAILQSINQRAQALADQAVSELRTSEEKFKAIVQAAKDYSIIMLDPQGNILTWNEGARLIKGYEAEEIIGRSFSTFYSLKDRLNGVPEHVLQRALANGVYKDEGWRVKKNGSRFWAEVTVTPIFDSAGKLIGFSKIVRDLTAKKAVENERNQLISILDSAPDFVGIADMAGNLKYHNPAAKKLVGLPENSDLSQMKIGDMHPKWAGELVLREGIPAVLSGISWRKDTALLHRKGYEIPVSQVLMVHRDENGEPKYLSTIMRDITESRRQTRREQLERGIDQILATSDTENDVATKICKVIVEHLGWDVGVFWKASLDGRILEAVDSYFVDDASYKDFLESSDLTRSHQSTDLPREVVDKKQIVTRNYREQRMGFGFPVVSVNIVIGCFEFYSMDSGLPDAHLLQVLMDLQPRIAQRLLYLQAKAQLAERYHLLQSIIDGFPSPLVVRDLQGRFLIVNKKAADNLNTTTDKMIGKSTQDYVEKEVADLSVHGDRQVIESGVVHQSQRTSQIGGVEHTFLVSRFPLRDLRGKIISVCTVATDISEQVRLTNELKGALDKAKSAEMEALEAVKAKDRFLASMSHEIRTPLNGVIGMTDLLNETNLDEQQREYIGIVQQSGTALLALINDILDFSKIEAGKLELERTEFSLCTLVEMQVEILLAKAREKKLTVSTFSSPSLPKTMTGDPSRLGQVLLNLISNALKFTETGGVAVRAFEKARTGPADSGVWVRFEVEDTGIGISDSAKAKLFQPFSQADETVSRKYGGTGLGLSICKRLVEAMGGEIGVESDAQGGSVFWFEVPFEKGVQKSAPRIARGDSTLSGMRILVLEGDSLSRDAIHRYFQAWGMRSECVEDAEEAMQLCKQASSDKDPYRIVVMGAGLSVQKSLTLGRKLKNFLIKGASKQPSISEPPVLILALNFDQIISRAKLLQSNFDASIHKPVKQSQLFDSLVTALHGEKSGQKVPSLESGEATESSESGTSVAVLSDKSKFRVLVADDLAANQMLARKLLESLGYSVSVAANGLEVIEIIKKIHCDLILMDCQMPELDGFEATAQIRTLDDTNLSRIPIVALTANAMAGDAKRCLNAGMNDYLSKPIRKEALRTMLEKWLKDDANQSPKAA